MTVAQLRPRLTRVAIAGCVTGVLACSGAFVTQATAEPMVLPEAATVTLTPGALSFDPVQTATYEVDLTAGATGATFPLGLASPAWPGYSVPGSPIALGGATYEGPGTMSLNLPDPPPIPYDPFPPCRRGSLGDLESYEITMPPDSVSTVSLPLSLAVRPWNRQPIQPRFTVGATADYRELDVPAIQVGGGLATWVQVRQRGTRKQGIVRRSSGNPFTLVGHVFSSSDVAGKTVRLFASSRTEPTRTFLAKARVGRKGNFLKRVAGLESGEYGIEGKVVGDDARPGCGLRARIEDDR